NYSNRYIFTVALSRTHGLRRRFEETKNRRRASRLKPGWRPARQPGRDKASAATRFARQRVRESRIQTAPEPALLVCAILRLVWSRPKGRRRRRGFVSASQ